MPSPLKNHQALQDDGMSVLRDAEESYGPVSWVENEPIGAENVLPLDVFLKFKGLGWSDPGGDFR
jgi:hypothetical protein